MNCKEAYCANFVQLLEHCFARLGNSLYIEDQSKSIKKLVSKKAFKNRRLNKQQ